MSINVSNFGTLWKFAAVNTTTLVAVSGSLCYKGQNTGRLDFGTDFAKKCQFAVSICSTSLLDSWHLAIIFSFLKFHSTSTWLHHKANHFQGKTRMLRKRHLRTCMGNISTMEKKTIWHLTDALYYLDERAKTFPDFSSTRQIPNLYRKFLRGVCQWHVANIPHFKVARRQKMPTSSSRS